MLPLFVIEGDWYKRALRFKFSGDRICHRCDTIPNEKEQATIPGHNSNEISASKWRAQGLSKFRAGTHTRAKAKSLDCTIMEQLYGQEKCFIEIYEKF